MPKPAQPKSPKSAQPHPITQAFLYEDLDDGYGYPAFDVNVNEWYLNRVEGALCWSTLPPSQKMVNLPATLTEADLDQIPVLLAFLATQCGLAHQISVSLDSLDTPVSHRSDVVLAPPSDSRVQGKPTIVCPRLPPGVFVLLPEPEELGRMVKRGDMYGLILYDLPRAVSLSLSGFTGTVR